jgi:exodeoxyribonuclease VII large subunit
MVAIGHEVDLSLAELAADRRASTPSNAVQQLVPDKGEVQRLLKAYKEQATNTITTLLAQERQTIREELRVAGVQLTHELRILKQNLVSTRQLLVLLHPANILKRGYAIVRYSGKVVRSARDVKLGAEVQVQLSDGSIVAAVKGKVQ